MTSNAAPKFVARRGRPSMQQVAAIERTILDTARRMFLDAGYDAVAMESVAAVAGISKGTLYARHPSKESLFEAVVKSSVVNWSEDAARHDHLLIVDDIRLRLKHHARTIARSLVNPEVRAFQRLLLAQSDRFPKLARAMYENGYLYIVHLLVADIEAAGRRDCMPPRDPVGVAKHLVAALTGWHLQETAVREVAVAEIEAFGDRAVDMVMAGRTAW